MAKDKVIGALVIILGLGIAIIYTMGSMSSLGGNNANGLDLTSGWLGGIDLFSWELFIVLPIWLLVILISIIAIWIGYSMLTTPAPVPLEELEEELAAEEEAE